jgi:hypothetical protein
VPANCDLVFPFEGSYIAAPGTPEAILTGL